MHLHRGKRGAASGPDGVRRVSPVAAGCIPCRIAAEAN